MQVAGLLRLACKQTEKAKRAPDAIDDALAMPFGQPALPQQPQIPRQHDQLHGKAPTMLALRGLAAAQRNQ